MKSLSMIVILSAFCLNLSIAGPKDSLSVQFESDNVILKGKLILPKGEDNKVPAVIFLIGSGGYGSYSKDYKGFLEFFLERPFRNDDVAFMFFDKRGVGESEGIWYKADFEQRARDAMHAAEFLKTVPQIDQEKIYVVGHSQGGWIVQICLSEYSHLFAGGISMAGPTFNVKKQLINDYQSAFICNKDLDPAGALKKAKRRVNRDLTIVSILPLQKDWKQLKVIRKFDPNEYLLNIKKPLLFLFAENDRLVNPEWSLEHLNELYPNGLPDNFTYHIAAGENHSFKTSPFCYKGAWSDLKFSEKTKNVMVDWIKNEIGNVLEVQN
ncbi:alpha/beta hydrolase family protein [Pararhodonellum marinum]|uniref:alpha/beta hydrolase family protein n=1 Tax=Pararhodonellum marinum TaxID=2755358 RepID=UPI00188ED750|nr:alpha/beta fold hydrolase [Pararhodonellum marinum]